MIDVKGKWEFVETLEDVYKVLRDNIGLEFTDATAKVIDSKIKQKLNE